MSRGNNRQKIFLDDADRTAFLLFLEEYARQLDITIFAYVLMENHVHLLLEVADQPLSEFMRRLLARYTQRFNKRHGQVGHLFQGRYKAILCERDSYLLELVRYIHLNPVRSRLAERPESFPWSSHRAYLGLVPARFVAVDPVLGIFGPSWNRARKAFKRFVEEGQSQGHRADLYTATEGRFLGSDEFVQVVRADWPRTSRRPSRIRQPRSSLNEITTEIGEELGVSPQDIRGTSRARSIATARASLAFKAVVLHGYKGAAVAEWLGCDRSAVTRAVQRADVLRRAGGKVNIQH